MKVERTDFIISAGLILLWVGLFLWLGVGISLAVVGSVLLLLGIFGVIFPEQKETD